MQHVGGSLVAPRRQAVTFIPVIRLPPDWPALRAGGLALLACGLLAWFGMAAAFGAGAVLVEDLRLEFSGAR